MLRVCLLMLFLAPLAAAQPLAEQAAPDARTVSPAQDVMVLPLAEPVTVAPEALPRLAIVVQQQAAGSSCDGGGGSDCGSDCSPDCSGSGGGCDGGDLGVGGYVVLGGCAVLTGGAIYGIWKLIKGRRSPKPDTLGGLSLTAQALTPILSERFEIVGASPEADVTLTVREMAPVRQGIGTAASASQLEVSARDRAGRPLALDDGPIPSTRLVLAIDDTLPQRLRDLSTRIVR